MGRTRLVSVSKRHLLGESYVHVIPTGYQRYAKESDEYMFVDGLQTERLHSRQKLKIWLERKVSALILSPTRRSEMFTLANSSVISRTR